MQAEAIIEFVELEEEDTIDIEVDNENHIFYANGVAGSNSHSVPYALEAYWSAYLKYYCPLTFYHYWLIEADNKLDPKKEKRGLILSAKADGIEICPPSIKNPSRTFTINDGKIYFGLCDVKNVADRCYDIIVGKEGGWENIRWIEAMFYLLKIEKRSVENLISVGAFSIYGKSRTEMLHEISCLRTLTDNELMWLETNYSYDHSLQDNILRLAVPKKEGGGIATVRRVKPVLEIIDRLNNPGRSLDDNPVLVAKLETELLCTAISCTEIDDCLDADFANTTCLEYLNGKNVNVTLAVQITKVHEHKTTKGDKMCFVSGEDSSGELTNIVLFPQQYESYSNIIYVDNTVLITGSCSKNGKDNSLIVEKVYQI